MIRKKSRYSQIMENPLLLGIEFAVLFWIVEALLDTFVFGEDTFLPSMFPPLAEWHEIMDRGAIATGIIVFVSYAKSVINKRKRADAALRESEERFRSLVQNASDTITVFDAEGIIRYESPSVERALEYRPEDMIGKNAFEFVHPDDVRQVSDSFARLLEHPGVRRPIEFRIRHADGSWRYFESIANNLLEDPKVCGIVINSRDVTERKLAEDALARTLQAKTDFIADISHELRTPLTMLRGNAEVGLEIKDERVHKEIFEDIVKQSERMSRMVEDLLFLARSDSDSPLLQLREIDAVPFLEELSDLSESLVRERGGVLRSELNCEGQLRIDPSRIEQAVLILVDNAVKYSPEGEQITLSTTTKSGELRIEVEDRGPGIDDAELSRIFDRFYRSETTRAQGRNGSGLGLSIAKTIAEIHGGRIEATSRLNEGTRMSLQIPLADEAPVAEPSTSSPYSTRPADIP